MLMMKTTFKVVVVTVNSRKSDVVRNPSNSNKHNNKKIKTANFNNNNNDITPSNNTRKAQNKNCTTNWTC